MLLLLCPFPGGPGVACRLEPPSVPVGGAARLVIVVRGPEAADCAVRPWKRREDLVVLRRKGPFFSMAPGEAGGGPELHARFEVEVVPLEEGRIPLPAVEVLLPGGGGLSRPAPELEVRPRIASGPGEGTVLRLVGPGRRVYLNERFRLRLELDLPRDRFDALRAAPTRERFLVPTWEGARLPWRLSVCGPAPAARPALSLPLAWTEGMLPFVERGEGEGEGSGAAAERVRLACTLAGRAERTGSFRVPPSCFRAALPDGEVLFARSAPLQVEVAPLPAAGRPASATNGVGPLRVRFRLERRVFEEGKPVSFRFEVEGEGDLSYLVMPEFGALASAFEVAAVQNGGEGNRRYRSFQLLLRDGKARTFPALAFSWYDPESGRYETARFGPVPVEVKAGVKGAPRDAVPPGRGNRTPVAWIAGAGSALAAGLLILFRLRARRRRTGAGR